jgi:hypothetical protein
MYRQYISEISSAYVCPMKNRPERWRAQSKKRREKKKMAEKALIPLPPTGLVSFFCANPDVVQTNLQPGRAVGPCRESAISQIAKF